MNIYLSIQGSIPVGARAASALYGLREQLEVSGAEAEVSDGFLTVDISTHVPRCYPALAIAAIDAFCTVHATDGAVFEYINDLKEGVLLFGPTMESRWAAHVNYLSQQIVDLQAQHEQATCTPIDKYNTPYPPQ